MENYNDNQNPMEQKPNNLLVWSILVTILFCWPLGIPAIVYSARVNKLWDSGDRQGAYDAAKKAKTFCLLSFILGVVALIIVFATGNM